MTLRLRGSAALLWIAVMIGAMSVALLIARASSAAQPAAGAPSVVTIIDTLGSWTRATVFPGPGSGGLWIGTTWQGQRFELPVATVITEFGAFIRVISDDCPTCVSTHPLEVDVRPGAERST